MQYLNIEAKLKKSSLKDRLIFISGAFCLSKVKPESHCGSQNTGYGSVWDVEQPN